MHQPLEVETLVAILLDRLQDAATRRAVGVHVQLLVPADSRYEWLDDHLVPHVVHLPTKVRTSELETYTQPEQDGGPAAVFTLGDTESAPPEEGVREMAFELYRQAIRWGRMTHTPWDVQPTHDVNMLPRRFERLVDAAIMSDLPA
ncbi:MAG: hypothetical protein JWO69_546 [Thermoleophilia bacterium]|nr:hypothetical protein [Thermoleophilia bacterium]